MVKFKTIKMYFVLMKDFKLVTNKWEETKKESDLLKQDVISLKTSLEKLKGLEKDLLNIKKDGAADKLSVVEKEILSLRVDYEKCLKEVKSLSTEVKFIDSNIKKDASGSKSEFSSLSKTIKGKEQFSPFEFLLILEYCNKPTKFCHHVYIKKVNYFGRK